MIKNEINPPKRGNDLVSLPLIYFENISSRKPESIGVHIDSESIELFIIYNFTKKVINKNNPIIIMKA